MNFFLPPSIPDQLGKFWKIYTTFEIFICFSDGEKSDDGVELEPDIAKDSNVTKWVVCSGIIHFPYLLPSGLY